MLKNRSYASLALAVAIATAVGPPTLFKQVPAQAQLVAATFSLPETVPDGTQIKISSGADSMTVISEALKQKFEGDFSGTAVEVNTVGADAAIQDVLAGNVDLAAISRPLTPEEEAQGLVAETVHRVKIAVVVGANNAFSGTLAGDQFADMFRGEITDWSEVGGTGSLTFVDRPDTSDTRKALAGYPVFKAGPFETGANANQLEEDSNTALAEALGDTGIGYMLASELEGVSGIRVLEMHKTLPSDPRYPFSQPFSYVYKGDASPAVSAFLGYATAEPGQSAVQSVAGDGLGSVSDVVQSASNAAGETAGAVGDAANEAKNAAGETASAIGDAANEAKNAAGDALNDAAGAAGNALNDATGAAGDAAGQAGEAIEQTTPDAAAGAAGNIAEEASKGFGSLRWLFLIPIALAGLWLWLSRGKATPEAAVGADEDLDPSLTADGVGGTGSAGTPGISNLGKAVTGGAALAGGAGAAAMGMANRTKNTATNAAQGTVEGLQGKVGGALGGLKGKVGDLQGKASGAMGDLPGKAGGAMGDLQGKVGDLPGKAGDAVNKVTDLPAKGGNWAAGAAGAAAAGAAGLGGMAAKARQKATEGIDSAQNLAGDAAGTVQEGVQGRLHGMETPLTQAQKRMADMADQVSEGSRNLADRAQGQVQNLQGKVDGIKQQSSDKVINLYKDGTQQVSDVADEIIDTPES
ncbi:MAG: substrate-binding domain-containing protein [Cyanobacteria bacterium J06635_1]